MPIKSGMHPKSPGILPAVNQRKHALFELGQCVCTPTLLKHFQNNGVDPVHYLRQHSFGLWGDVPAEDARENDLSVVNGYRVLSAYSVAGIKFWIITEKDRSLTTLLTPSEY
jgi:hypothetical protein